MPDHPVPGRPVPERPALDRRGVIGVLVFMALLKVAAVTGPWQSPLVPEGSGASLLWSGVVFLVVWGWLRGIADVGRALDFLSRLGR